ncbi:hypothetical protein P775_11005 [Puniceibacterium antarcticum]|uniref:Uncharacterized protein n=1 Tax=Puniceibacterium antarcticum TaxID=1206336 RepID=A0A2G8RF76_9RHOB|nr:hypothetical protein [Puniceibacterium antarcticum]PIL20189.1 hypothetical protein P775_11005 [Puniceibacterium antarcticum]
MTTFIKHTRANGLATARKINPPVTDGLVGVFIFGGTLAQSVRNLATGVTDASVIGSPAIGESYLDLTGNSTAYIQTAIAHSEDLTWISACRPLTDTTAALISNYWSNSQSYGGQTIGGNLILSENTVADGLVSAQFTQAFDAAGTSTAAQANTGAPGFAIGADYIISGRVDQIDRTRSVTNITTGASGTNKPALNPADLGGPIRIGSAYNSQFAGQARHYAAILYDRKISDEQLTLMNDWLAIILDARGISV